MKNSLLFALLIAFSGSAFSEIPSVTLYLTNSPPFAPIVVQTSGNLNFSIENSTDLENWGVYLDVFSRVLHLSFNVFDRSPEGDTAQRQFFQGAKLSEAPSQMFSKWQALGNAHYRFKFKRVCGCTPNLLTATITVQNGIITNIDNAQPSTASVEDFKTVDQIFQLLLDQVNAAELLTVRYDVDRFFPRWLEINPKYDLPDDEVEYHVDNFTILP